MHDTVWPPNSRFLGPGIFREFEIRELKIWSLTTPNSRFSSQFTELAKIEMYYTDVPHTGQLVYQMEASKIPLITWSCTFLKQGIQKKINSAH